MMKKSLLAASVASSLLLPSSTATAGVYLPPKPAIVKGYNLEMSKHMLLGMPLTMGMLTGRGPPTIIAATASSTSASSTSYTVSLPTGIVSGDLLIAVVGNNADRTHTWPAGWTELKDDKNGTISAATIGYRTANGSEGSSITVTASSGAASAHVAVRITGVFSTPTATTAVVGATSSPDSSSASVGTGKLYLAIAAGRSSVTVTDPPTGYTNSVSSNNVSGPSFAAIAYLSSSASTSDPGAWALSSSANWVAWTVAV